MNLVVGVTLYSQPNYYHKILAIDYNWQLANIKNTVCIPLVAQDMIPRYESSTYLLIKVAAKK